MRTHPVDDALEVEVLDAAEEVAEVLAGEVRRQWLVVFPLGHDGPELQVLLHWHTHTLSRHTRVGNKGG